MTPRPVVSSWRWAWLLIAVGVVGIFFTSVDLLRRIVIVAPVVEEMLKLGLALVLVLALDVRQAWSRVALALVPGVLFGVFEHAVAYPTEGGLLEATRLLFHAGSTALSMACFHLVEGAPSRWWWGSTLAATCLHMVNNGAAVLAAAFGLGGLDVALTVAALSVVLAGVAHGAAWGLAFTGARARRVLGATGAS